jgi:D-inositol-3-phosphate glycosyltransferase
MEITYFGPLPPYTGGIAQHGDNLIRGLLQRGHRVQSTSWRHQYPRRLYPGTLPDTTQLEKLGSRAVASWYDPLSWARVGWRASTGDALVTPWVTAFHTPAVLTAHAASRSVARIAIVHNALPHERHLGDEALATAGLRGADGAVVHATTVADDLDRLVPNLPVVIVPHPPNLPLTPTSLPPSVPRLKLLLFGYVRAYKGIETALDALQELRTHGLAVEATIAGQYWEPRSHWEREVSDRGLEEVVDLRDGYVPDTEVATLFAEHHLLVAPYRSATQSGTIPLARAAGRAVVATDVGGLREAVEHGVDGLLVPPDDPGALATAIEDAATHLEELGQRSAARVTSWGDVADAVVSLIK